MGHYESQEETGSADAYSRIFSRMPPHYSEYSGIMPLLGQVRFNPSSFIYSIIYSMTTRRNFLKITGPLSLAALLPEFPGWTNPSQSVGIQLYTVRELMNQDPKGTLKKLAAIGYKQLESYQGDKGIYFGLKPKEFVNVVKDLEMELFGSHFNIKQNPEATIAEAAANGIRYMICPFNKLTDLDSYKRAMEEYVHLGEVCQKNGIQFGYHNHGYEFEPLDGVLPYDLFLKQIDAKLMVMEMELYWFARMDKDPLAYIQQYPGRFPLWHVKDMDKQDHTLHTEVGKGSIDYQRLFAHAAKAGLKYAMVEQDGHFQPSAWESLKTSYTAVKAMKRG